MRWRKLWTSCSELHSSGQARTIFLGKKSTVEEQGSQTLLTRIRQR